MVDTRDSESSFGVLDFLSWDHPKFGRHYTAKEVEKSAALMREAGVGFVRFDFLWEDIEPKSEHLSFMKYDRIVDILVRHGLKIQGLLAYNAVWAVPTWNHAPDLIRYSQYARHVVEHFKDRVKHWQIWHEPDNPAFWQPQDEMAHYTELLKHVYPLLKATDPTCVIHLGGMSQSLPMCLKNVYERGGRNYFDVINIHPFANPLNEEALEGLRMLHQTVLRVLHYYGDSAKPIWFTEIGCPGMKDPASTPDWWLGKNPDEKTQAEWVRTVYGELLNWENVKKIFWCFFRDTPAHFKSGSDFDGLIRNDFSKKPSFEMYQKISLRQKG